MKQWIFWQSKLTQWICHIIAWLIAQLDSKRIQDNILDNQLLDAIRVWLEPLPDRSLPSLDIQSQMLDALDSVRNIITNYIPDGDND